MMHAFSHSNDDLAPHSSCFMRLRPARPHRSTLSPSPLPVSFRTRCPSRRRTGLEPAFEMSLVLLLHHVACELAPACVCRCSPAVADVQRGLGRLLHPSGYPRGCLSNARPPHLNGFAERGRSVLGFCRVDLLRWEVVQRLSVSFCSTGVVSSLGGFFGFFVDMSFIYVFCRAKSKVFFKEPSSTLREPLIMTRIERRDEGVRIHCGEPGVNTVRLRKQRMQVYLVGNDTSTYSDSGRLYPVQRHGLRYGQRSHFETPSMQKRTNSIPNTGSHPSPNLLLVQAQDMRGLKSSHSTFALSHISDPHPRQACLPKPLA